MSIRLGVVGTGWWATFNHIPVAQADARSDVVAIMDLDAARLAETGQRFSIEHRYTELETMLAEEPLDGVMIATPHVAHFEAARAALDAGCHVLVEKPMTTTSTDAHALIAAADKIGKQVLVPCGWNFKSYTARAFDLVSSGAIGEIRHVTCQMASALGDLFAGEPMLETVDHQYRPPASTWADPRRSGGYAWGQMSHSLAWIYAVTELAPQSVFAMTGHSPTGVDYYDAAAVRMTNGVTVALSGAATVPKHCGFQLEVRLFGSEGMLLFDVERERLEVRRHDQQDVVIDMPPGSGGYEGDLPVTRFIDICAGLSTAVNHADVRNGARVVDTLDALYRSAASGQLATVQGTT